MSDSEELPSLAAALGRIGLVLSGGGAKGAYQAGVLLALADNGVTEFQVISGTSVGALNGVAVAAGKQRELSGVWQTISFGQILKPSRQAVHLGVGLGEFLLGWLIEHAFFASLATTPVSLVLLKQLSSEVRRRRHFREDLRFAFQLAAVPAFLHLVRFHRALGHRVMNHAGHYLGAHAVLSEQSRLRSMVADLLAGSDSTNFPPTYFALAAEVPIFDPDEPHFASYVADGKKHSDFPHIYMDVEEPEPVVKFIPRYIDIRALELTVVTETVLRSAALPIVFTSSELGADTVRDGGLIDNVPLGPALRYPLDTLIVITLDSKDRFGQIMRRSQEAARLIRIEQLGDNATFAIFDKWRRSVGLQKLHRTREFPYSRFRRPEPDRLIDAAHLDMAGIQLILHFKPSSNLGGFLRGTLNFGRRRANKLLKMGYEDLMRGLQQIVEDPSAHLSTLPGRVGPGEIPFPYYGPL